MEIIVIKVGCRAYDPKMGRFLTGDPAGQSFNPYFKEAHAEGLGNYDPDEKYPYPVVVEKPLFDGSNFVDPMLVHTQIIEPEGLSEMRTWSFGEMNDKNPNGLMAREDMKSYKGGRITHRFTNIDRYLAAKAIVTPKYENHSYDFQRFKCHNPIRDMIDATR